jgi:PAS domain S-box-containing protein
VNHTTAAAKRRTLRWGPYAAAVVLTGATLVFRLAVSPWVGDRPLLILFFIPIVISAYWGGLVPGLFATALTGLAVDYFLFPPAGNFGFSQPLDFAQWLFLLLEGVLISVLFAQFTRARRAELYQALEVRRATTERKVLLGFAVAVAFLGTIGVVSYLSVVRLNENSLLVTRSHSVMTSIDRLVATTWEAESAQRGYVISGEELFAAEYTRAIGRIDGLVQQLRDAVSGDAAQLARVEPLVEALRGRLRQSAEIVDLRRAGGLEAVQRRMTQSAAAPGASLQTRVRTLAQEMKSAEIRQLNAREAGAERSAQIAQSVIVGGSALALLCVGMALLAIRRDFAGRERAESEIDSFFSLSFDCLTIAHQDGYFRRVSPAVTDLLGWSEEEFLGRPWLEFVHPDDHERTIAQAALQKAGQRVLNFENRYRHKDGSWRVMSWRSTPKGDLMYGIARDVTDSVRAEQELRDAKEQLETRVAERTRELGEALDTLRKSERRFRALIEHGSDSIALLDRNATVLYVSPAVRNVEGYSPEEIVGLRGRENAHPDDVPVLRRTLEHVLAHPGKPAPMLWRRRHKDGRWIWLEGVVTNLLDDPSVGAIVTNYRDVTDRLAHEARMAEQLRRLALLGRITHAIGERQDLGSILSAVAERLEEELPVDFCCFFARDAAANQLTVSCIGTRSAAAAASLGLAHDSAVPIDENGLARCVRGQLVYEPEIVTVPFRFPQLLAGAGLGAMVIAPLLVESQVFGVLVCARRAAQGFSSGECEFLRQVSEHTALASHQAQLYGALQSAYDDLRQTQQQVMQQERLRALGQMASGIAHDINNAISPVSLYTEALIEHEHDISPRGRQQLEIIQRAVDDVAQTVARMGEFYRAREPQLSLVPVDLNKLVKQVVDLTRVRWSDMVHQRGAAIDVRLDLAADLPAISAVQGQVRDALVNLVFNAVDAMPNGGPLTLRTRMLEANAVQSAQLEVIDAGVGMDEETRRRCLEPFFTTKGTRGTGLGLAMVYGVAQRHGAGLEIESAPGQGTTVRMSFAAASEPAATGSGSHRLPAGPLRMLLIDDDPLLLKTLRDTLETEGHDVVSANGGQAGIDAFVAALHAGKPFPLVITDLGMPRVDGRKVAASIKSAAPSTVVLMLTGWGHRLSAEGELPPHVDQVLSKPPKVVDLRAAFAQYFPKVVSGREN